MSGRYHNEDVILNDLHMPYFHGIRKKFMTGSLFEYMLYWRIVKTWKNWTANNGHNALPPDYYSDKWNLGFDVMRVFDSEFTVLQDNGKIKYVNPVAEEESRLFKKIKRQHPDADAKQIFIIMKPEDNYHSVHTYQQYCDNARRVLKKHLDKCNGIRERHPTHKIGFLVFDTTAIYIQHMYEEDARNPIDENKKYMFHPRPHFPILDRAIMEDVYNSDLDFIIWASPEKLNVVTGVQIPGLVFWDLRKKNKIKLIDYPAELMRCT